MTDQFLAPILIQFHGDTLWAIELADRIDVACKPISDRLGLSWPRQFRRLTTDPILSQGIAQRAIPTPSGVQEMLCLRLDLVPGWLFGIDSRRVRPSIQEVVLRYQLECYRVLFEHFYRRQTGADTPVVESWGQLIALVAEVRLTFGPRVAAELYLSLHGLPSVPGMRRGPEQGELAV